MFFAFGELVHNKIVTNSLKENGLVFVENLEGIYGNVIIRAHGIKKDIYEYMNKRKINFFDYTCPNVLNIHNIASSYKENGYFIFLLGDSKHPENIGTISFCGDNSFIIDDESFLEKGLSKFKISQKSKLLVIAQTTYSVKNFEKITEKIKNSLNKNVELVIKNTICNATEKRQKETKEIAKKVEYMIIIGGKNSSNTKKLFDIAKENCKNAICIESKDELNLEEVRKYEVIGIMAGASTPKASIDEVCNELLENKINV